MVMITMFDADLLLTLMCKLLSSIYQAFFLHWTQPQRKVTNRSGEFAVSEYSAWPSLLWGRNCHWPAFPGDAGRLDCFQRAVEGDDPFPARWCPVALKSRRQISQCWTSGVVQAAREVTGSSFVTSFFRGMRGAQIAYRRFLQLWRNWKFLKQFAWRLRIHFRASGPN